MDGPSIVYAHVGQSHVTIKCTVCGQPRPLETSYSWSFMPTHDMAGLNVSDVISWIHSDVIIIDNVAESHYGVYTCMLPDLLDPNNTQTFDVKLVNSKRPVIIFNWGLRICIGRHPFF